MAVAAVDRCIRLIELLADAPEGLTVSDLAGRLVMPKSGVHRMLATLAERGYVMQDPRTQAYAGTLRLAALGFRCLDARHLPDAAQQILDRLARSTGEYCRLALADGRELVWVARAQGATQGLRYDPPMSLAVVLHATASGKAWLAAMPENEALELACARGLHSPPNAGPNVVRTVDALRRQLAEVRRRGYAIASDEAEDGTWACAVVFHAGDAPAAPVAGTVSVAAPQSRMRGRSPEPLVARLSEAARELAAVWPLHRRQRAALSPASAANAATAANPGSATGRSKRAGPRR